MHMLMHAVYSVTLSLKLNLLWSIRIKLSPGASTTNTLDGIGRVSVAVVGNKAIDLVAIVIRAP